MGQITGNDKDFPTIKQVNDALGSVGGTLDISIKEEEFRSFFGTPTDDYIVCNNINLRNMMNTLSTGKYNQIQGNMYGMNIPIQIINKDSEPICIFNWYIVIDKILTTVLKLKTYEFKTVEFDKSSSGNTLDLSNYAYSIMSLIETSEYKSIDTSMLGPMLDKISNGNYTWIKSTDGLIFNCPLNIISNNGGIKYMMFDWYDIGGQIFNTCINLTQRKYKTVKSVFSPY